MGYNANDQIYVIDHLTKLNSKIIIPNEEREEKRKDLTSIVSREKNFH